jgi:nitrogen fixation-related uncharacterized protein
LVRRALLVLLFLAVPAAAFADTPWERLDKSLDEVERILALSDQLTAAYPAKDDWPELEERRRKLLPKWSYRAVSSFELSEYPGIYFHVYADESGQILSGHIVAWLPVRNEEGAERAADTYCAWVIGGKRRGHLAEGVFILPTTWRTVEELTQDEELWSSQYFATIPIYIPISIVAVLVGVLLFFRYLAFKSAQARKEREELLAEQELKDMLKEHHRKAQRRAREGTRRHERE